MRSPRRPALFLSFEDGAAQKERRIRITAESVTVGSEPSADIQIQELGRKLLIEIKYHDESWWIVNPLRSSFIKLNSKSVELDAKLSPGDRIALGAFQLNVDLEILPERKTYAFRDTPANDEQLWNYLVSEMDFDEVMINGHNKIFVDYQGQVLLAPWKFSSNEFLIQTVRAQTKKDFGWSAWRLHRRLRIQSVLPPNVEIPHICIRKGRQQVFSIPELVERKFMTEEQAGLLEQAIQQKEVIVISGATSTGKTVLCRSLVEQIPYEERLLIVEEEAETDWPHPHAVQIEAGRGNLRPTIIECLRMRPDRLVISEIRGAEAFDFLQAINTGHAGSMTTVHANSPREALYRLENLVLSSGLAVHLESVRAQLAQCISLIVQCERDEAGIRKIESISRVSGIQQGVILLGDPIELEARGVKQELRGLRDPRTKK